ncbi:MAG: hypothetical protein LUE26_05855 [Alistipes sp.]|nr:hypothetical protein [Alistipes sp.]
MEEELRDFNPFNGRLPLLEVYHTYSRSHWDWELVEEYEPGEVLWVFYMDNIYINRKGCVWYNGSVKGFDRERPELEGRFTYIPEISTMKIVIPHPPELREERDIWNADEYERIYLVYLPEDDTVRCTDLNARGPNVLYVLGRRYRRRREPQILPGEENTGW